MSGFDDIAGDPNQIITGGFATVGRYAVIGHPVRQSRSPELHTAWFQAASLPGTYHAEDIAPDELIRRGPSLPFEYAGLNITVPHKVAILGYVDRVDENAQAAGAANLVYRDHRRDKAWTAGNTDGEGFVRAFEEATSQHLLGKDVVILGAGGAARSIGAALMAQGVGTLTLVNRDHGKAEAVSEAIGSKRAALLTRDCLDKLDVSVDLLVNTLPPEAEERLSALDLTPLGLHAIVVDINYYLDKPVLLDRAAERGLAVLDGAGMFLWQAALSFERWTGQKPDMDLGRNVLGIQGWQT